MEETESVSDQDAASHWSRQEWLLMFMSGVPVAKIATVCRVPQHNVSSYIRGRLTAEPWRRGRRLMIHDQPCLPSGPIKEKQPSWEERCQGLHSFVQEHGRLPSVMSKDSREQSLIYWIYTQRRKFRAGELAEEQLMLLNEIPEWNKPPRQDVENTRWDHRLTETRAFHQQHGRWPRYRQGQSPGERVIAVWLDTQRQKLGNGTLRPDRETLLNQQLPGWKPKAT